MIFVGYQGVGKSTLVKSDKRYIDLESGNFWYDHGNGTLQRDELWYLPYCNIAEDLSRQGFRVFVSSHKVVRDRLNLGSETIYAIYPHEKLKDLWIKKLEDRYNLSGLNKDYKAYINAKNIFSENIKEIANSITNHIVIDDMNYDLGELIESNINKGE